MKSKRLARQLAVAAVGFGLLTGAAEAAYVVVVHTGQEVESRTVGVIRTASTVGGRKAGYCDAYSRRAMRAQETNERLNCGFTGPRWHMDEDAHFEWCMNAPRGRTESIALRRRDRLQRCRERGGNGEDNYCRSYARRAVRAQETNERLDCGFTGPRWHLDSENHYQWCLNAPRKRADFETETRREQLEQCRTGDGGSQDGFCQTYARRAVNEQRINEELGCAYTGPRWTSDRDAHYEWCRNVPRARAESEGRARRRQLQACR